MQLLNQISVSKRNQSLSTICSIRQKQDFHFFLSSSVFADPPAGYPRSDRTTILPWASSEVSVKAFFLFTPEIALTHSSLLEAVYTV